MEFKFILKKLIEENNITQTSLAKAIGFTPQAVNRWCTGVAEPSTEVLKKIANYFNVSVDYLLGNTFLEKEKKELNTLEQLLIKSGFIKPGEDLTKEELKRLMKFVNANKDFLKDDKKH